MVAQLQISHSSRKSQSGVKKIVIAIGVVWLVVMAVGAFILYVIKPFSSTLENPEAVVDKRELEVDITNPERVVLNPVTEVTVVANKPITSKKHNRVEWLDAGRFEGRYYYVARIINLPVGDSKVTLVVSDASGQEVEQELVITRKAFSMPPGFTQVSPWPDASYTLGADRLDAVVNKQNRLLEDYEPDDLVDLNKELGLYTLNNAHLRNEAALALKRMLEALRKNTGKNVTIASGYRSYETQVTTYSSWVRQLGETKANEVSARPGHSEHQLGTTVDFVSDETNWQITNKFDDTAAGKWLREHSEEFGFVIPYFSDESEEGGYKEESWHFRYVGTPLP